MTKDIGTNGNLFGGNMMAWMDEASAIFAMKVTGEKDVVSLRFAEIIFKHPVKQDDIVDFYADNVRKGRTSVTFDIIAEVDGKECFRTECTFVAVDANGSKKSINW
jgi:acyl-CoA thioesterase YciA